MLLYVDEAHAFGVRGRQGLGCAEESGCTGDIDFLVATFGKAAASAGAYIVCRKVIREYLVNRMRTLIFTTGLPPVNIAWTLFVVRRLADMRERREHLAHISRSFAKPCRHKDTPAPRQPHRPDDYRAECGYRAESRDLATAWLLRPARAPAYSAGRNVAHPFFADSDIRQEEIEELKKRTENLK